MSTTRTLDDDQMIDYLYDHNKGFLEQAWLDVLEGSIDETDWVKHANNFMIEYDINLVVISARCEDDLFIWEVSDK